MWDRRLPPQLNLNSSVQWFETDVSGPPIGSIFKGHAVQEAWPEILASTALTPYNNPYDGGIQNLLMFYIFDTVISVEESFFTSCFLSPLFIFLHVPSTLSSPCTAPISFFHQTNPLSDPSPSFRCFPLLAHLTLDWGKTRRSKLSRNPVHIYYTET